MDRMSQMPDLVLIPYISFNFIHPGDFFHCDFLDLRWKTSIEKLSSAAPAGKVLYASVIRKAVIKNWEWMAG